MNNTEGRILNRTPGRLSNGPLIEDSREKVAKIVKKGLPLVPAGLLGLLSAGSLAGCSPSSPSTELHPTSPTPTPTLNHEEKPQPETKTYGSLNLISIERNNPNLPDNYKGLIEILNGLPISPILSSNSIIIEAKDNQNQITFTATAIINQEGKPTGYQIATYKDEQGNTHVTLLIGQKGSLKNTNQEFIAFYPVSGLNVENLKPGEKIVVNPEKLTSPFYSLVLKAGSNCVHLVEEIRNETNPQKQAEILQRYIDLIIITDPNYPGNTEKSVIIKIGEQNNPSLLQKLVLVFSPQVVYAQELPIPPTPETATSTPTPTPTLTPQPTKTPTPTETPTPIPQIEVNGVKVPDPKITNPELFNLTKKDAPIPAFINALNKAGIKITSEKILQGLTYQAIEVPKRDPKTGEVIKDEKGNEVKETVVFGVYNLPPEVFPENYRDLAGPIPIFIAKENENGEWIWKSIGIKYLVELPIGTTTDFSDPNYNSNHYRNVVLNNFDFISLTGSFMEMYWNYKGYQYWPQFASKNGLSIQINNFFFNFDQTPTSGANDFIKNRIEKTLKEIIMNTKETTHFRIVLAGEPYFPYNGQVLWHGQYDDFMLYKELGQNWVVQAETELLNQILEKGIPLERFDIIGINLAGIEMPGYLSRYTINQVIKIKQEVFNNLTPEARIRLNINKWQDVPFDIGMEFHLGRTLGDRNLTVPASTDINSIIENVKEIRTQTGSNVHITEMDGIDDEFIIVRMMTRLITSKEFESICFFEPLKPSGGENDPWQNILFDEEQQPTLWYYIILANLLKQQAAQNPK
jgi:hypothetical protein